MSSCPPPRDYSLKVWCFQCGNEYFPEVTECIECGVATTSTKPPDVKILGKKDNEYHLAYDFHEWSGESRSMMESLLNGAEVLHIWQGATLFARETDEAMVDELIGEVDLASRPSLDPNAEKLEYDLEGFLDSQVTQITQGLEARKLPYQISSSGDLLVNSQDEAKVEALFDQLAASAKDSFGPGVPSADVPYILSELLSLSSKLEIGRPLNTIDISEGRRALEIVEQLDLPFGFNSRDWRQIVDKAQNLNELMITEVNEEITTNLQIAASKLREILPIYG